jgi:DNA-binding beta-propeller fold protein YncE
MRALGWLGIGAVLLAACGGATARRDLPVASESPAPIVAPAPAPAAAPMPAPDPKPYSKLRVFVASENTNSVFVLDGVPDGKFVQVGTIAVGRLPHQLSVSPDGKWVAVNNRMGNTTSIIDPVEMKEVARLMVGKQPHGITWTADSQTLFVAHEKDNYIARFDATTWKALPPLMVGAPQHVLTVNPARPNELWFTLTNTSESDVLREYDLSTNKVDRVKIGDVHDVYFTPDGSELWSSSSGFLDKPSDRMVIYDPASKTVKQEIHFPGHYPFHTLKHFQDGMYYPPDTSVMVLSDHTAPGLMWVDWRERKILGETKLGQQPFHSTYDPEGNRMLVTTNADGMVNVIDLATREVVQKLPVSKAHGIGSVGLP